MKNVLHERLNQNYAVACSNGTAALHLSVLVLVLKNDLVIVPSITFVATYNAVVMAGAQPIISDVDSEIILINLKQVEGLIKKYGQRIKAIIVVHLNGNVSKVYDIKFKYKNIKIIEDSYYALEVHTLKKEHNVGDCKYSDLSTFSFHPVKNITTGEGGMITTNNYKTFQELKLLRSHHISRLSLKYKLPFPYKINNLGYNYRLTDFQCALGRSQLKKLMAISKV